MDVTTHDPRTRREGMIDGLAGAEALEAVRKGHIWILLQQPHEIEGGYGDMLREVYAEIEERVPGFKSYKHKMSILISSPKVQVYYHADVPGQTLWQVRGTKRVYVYPNTAPFLPQPNIEKIVLGEAHEISLPYAPWYDEYAEVIDLEPGRMLHWPLNCPHRIVNADCLNVSFTTEHMTDELRNAYAVNYANGVLRRRLGAETLARPASGAGLYAAARPGRRPQGAGAAGAPQVRLQDRLQGGPGRALQRAHRAGVRPAQIGLGGREERGPGRKAGAFSS